MIRSTLIVFQLLLATYLHRVVGHLPAQSIDIWHRSKALGLNALAKQVRHLREGIESPIGWFQPDTWYLLELSCD